MRSRWLDIGQVLFCVFMDQVEVEVDKKAKNIKVNIQSNLLNKLGQTWPKRELCLARPIREILSG